jgi:hypothetical protein
MVRHTGEYFIDEKGVAISAMISLQPLSIQSPELDTPKAD